MMLDGFGRGTHLDPRIRLDGFGEALEPSILVARLPRTGPDPELLAVVAEDRHPLCATLRDAA